MTTVKNAPRKVTKAIDSSCVGQKMIEIGTHANGGTGRSNSNTGNDRPLNFLLTAISNPSGMPTTIAAVKPANTRNRLRYQLCQ